MRDKRRVGRPSPATVLASVALFVALSGTAIGDSAVTAAQRLVSGKDIKNNSVTSGDIRNNSITSRDIRNRSLVARDFKAGELPARVDTSNFFSKSESDSRYLASAGKAADSERLGGLAAGAFLRSNAAAGGALTGSYPAPSIAAGAVKGETVADGTLSGADIADGSLTLADLGGSRPAMTTTTSSPISLGAGECKAQLTGNFGDAVVGDLVVGTLTDANGNAVLPNTAAFIPSIVIKTTQGGAVPNLVVCNTGGSTLTIPTGSVFRWRLIDA